MDKDPDEHGFPAYLAAAIADAGFVTPTSFARAVPGTTKTDPSVVTRWLNGEARPSIKLLERIAPVLGRPVNELVAAAYPEAVKGAAKTSAPKSRRLHPLADELDRQLDQASPLSDDERQRVVVIVEAGLAPNRSKMKRRRAV